MWIIFDKNLLNLKEKLRITRPHYDEESEVWFIFIEPLNDNNPQNDMTKVIYIDAEIFPSEQEANTRFSELVSMLAPPSIKKNIEVDIEDLNLSLKATRILIANKIKTLSKLLNCTEQDLLKISGIGRTSIMEIKKRLHSMKLSLRDKNIPAH